MSRRSRARQIALQVLFQLDLNDAAVWERFVSGRLGGRSDLVRFANELITGVRDHLAELDQAVQVAMKNWKLARLSVSDRNVLRMATFEILHFGTPPKVAMNEAIELARRFGSLESAPFVNGVLDRILKLRQEGTLSQTAVVPPEVSAELSRPAE